MVHRLQDDLGLLTATNIHVLLFVGMIGFWKSALRRGRLRQLLLRGVLAMAMDEVVGLQGYRYCYRYYYPDPNPIRCNSQASP